MLSMRLKELRKNKGITQSELADKLQITQQAVARWESNKSEPDATTIRWLADFYGVSTDYLLGRGDNHSAVLSNEQENLLQAFSSLTREGRNMLLGILNSLKITHSLDAAQ